MVLLENILPTGDCSLLVYKKEYNSKYTFIFIKPRNEEFYVTNYRVESVEPKIFVEWYQASKVEVVDLIKGCTPVDGIYIEVFENYCENIRYTAHNLMNLAILDGEIKSRIEYGDSFSFEAIEYVADGTLDGHEFGLKYTEDTNNLWIESGKFGWVDLETAPTPPYQLFVYLHDYQGYHKYERIMSQELHQCIGLTIYRIMEMWWYLCYTIDKTISK